MLTSEIQIQLDIAESSFGQYVSSIAAQHFIELQGTPSNVAICLGDEASLSNYSSEHDLTLYSFGCTVDEILLRFRFEIFEEQFCRRFIDDLRWPAAGTLAAKLQEEFDSLKLQARGISSSLRDDPEFTFAIPGLQLLFQHNARLEESVTEAIYRRFRGEAYRDELKSLQLLLESPLP